MHATAYSYLNAHDIIGWCIIYIAIYSCSILISSTSQVNSGCGQVHLVVIPTAQWLLPCAACAYAKAGLSTPSVQTRYYYNNIL